MVVVERRFLLVDLNGSQLHAELGSGLDDQGLQAELGAILGSKRLDLAAERVVVEHPFLQKRRVVNETNRPTLVDSRHRRDHCHDRETRGDDVVYDRHLQAVNMLHGGRELDVVEAELR